MQRILSGIRLFCIFLSVCLIHTANLYLFLAKTDHVTYFSIANSMHEIKGRKTEEHTAKEEKNSIQPSPTLPADVLHC